MKVVLADRAGEALERATRDVAASSTQGTAAVIGIGTDVSRRDEVVTLRDTVTERFGPVSVLMNNAGVGNNPGQPWENSAAWRALVDVNLWGVVYGCEAFVPGMLARNEPGLVINTGSKQGITSPPGNAAYTCPGPRYATSANHSPMSCAAPQTVASAPTCSFPASRTPV